MDTATFRIDDLELDSLIHEMSMVGIDNIYDVIRHLGRYFPKPNEFLELIILHRLLISGYIPDLFRSLSSPIEASYIYYRALPSRYGNINAAIIDHLIRVQNAHYNQDGYFIIGTYKLILIDYRLEPDIQICKRIVLHYISIRCNPVIMTALGSHILSIQSSLQNMTSRQQSDTQDIIDPGIWQDSRFIPYFQSSSKSVSRIVAKYDPILAHSRKTEQYTIAST